MRCAEALAALLLFTPLPAADDPPTAVYSQRYAMGTMFEVLVYHATRPEAERAVERALGEVERLDRVLSHFRADSDLSRLVRAGGTGFVAVDPGLYEVLEQSIDMSRASNGAFDVTIGPLVKAWQAAQAAGDSPTAGELADAKRCVGYGKIQIRRPYQVRLASGCLALDLGGIGKGYAVERAVAVLRDAGIKDAVVNAGRSSIAAIGHAPGRTGWLVQVAAESPGLTELELHDASISTSQQRPATPGAGMFDAIIDPMNGRPIASPLTVVVFSPSATSADALSTALLLTPIERGKAILNHYPRSRAWWITADGRIVDTHAASSLSSRLH